MATRVYETIELELLDGKTILIKPLNLKNLRLVMKEWQEAQNAENEDEFLDVLIKCTSIAMTQLEPSIAENIDEVMDLQTMYKVLEIAADIKLNVPNQLAAVQAQVGTN